MLVNNLMMILYVILYIDVYDIMLVNIFINFDILLVYILMIMILY